MITWATNYDPYGLPFEQYVDTASALGFTGEFADPSGLLFLRARYYNPDIGCFFQLDPVEGLMQQPAKWNRYQYADLNPVLLSDPSGQIALIDDALILIALAVAATLLIAEMACYASPDCRDAVQNFGPRTREALENAVRDLHDFCDAILNPTRDIPSVEESDALRQAERVVEDYIQRTNQTVRDTDKDQDNDEENEPDPGGPDIPDPPREKQCDPREVVDWMVQAVMLEDIGLPQPVDPSDLAYQCRNCGDMEWRVRGYGRTVWADGIDVSSCRLLDCKNVRGSDSPRVLSHGRPGFLTDPGHVGSRPNFIQKDIWEFMRYGIVLRSSDNPFVGLRVITNNEGAIPYFQRLIVAERIPNASISIMP